MDRSEEKRIGANIKIFFMTVGIFIIALFFGLWPIFKYTIFLPWLGIVSIFGDFLGHIVAFFLYCVALMYFSVNAEKHTSSGYSGYKDPDDDQSESYYKAPHNGRCYGIGDDYPRTRNGSPDMRYSENYPDRD